MAGSSVIGALRVNLGLDSANFATGLKQASSKLASFSANVAKVAGAVAGTAVPALASMGISAMNAAAQIQRAAQLANAAPSEFQGWAAGAATVGIEQDKLADILKDVNDRVGDFIATGGGPMKDFFERIAPKVGVTAEQFRKLSGPDALQLYVKSLEKANLNQQDMTFFMEAMASDSTALLPLLKNSGAAMAEYAAKAQALGAVLDDKTVASFARAKQALGEVGLAFTGFKNIIAQQVVPPLAALAKAFVTAAQEGHWLGELVRGLAENIPRLTTYVATFLGVMGAKWAASFAIARVATLTLSGALATLRGAIMRTGIGLVVVAAGELIYQFTKLMTATGGFGNAMAALKSIAQEVWERIGDGTQYVVQSVIAMSEGMKKNFLWALHDMAGQFFYFAGRIAEAINSAFGTSLTTDFGKGVLFSLYSAGDDARIAAEAASAAATASAEAFRAPLKSLDDLRKTVEEGAASATTGVSNLGGGLDQLQDKAKGGKEKISDLQRVMKALREEAEKLKATMGMSQLDTDIWDKQREAGVGAESINGKQINGLMRQIDGMKRLKDVTEEWKQSISNAFSEFITKGGSFKSVLSQIIGKLAEMVFNKGFDALWGGAGGSKGLSSLASGALKLFGFANGTNFAPGGLARVNERGGEIMNLPRGTQVIPHDISKRMADTAGRQGGGGQISIGFDETIGSLTATMRDIAGQVVQVATPTIQRGAVKLTSQASHRSKAFMGI